ncbi:MAG: polymer-forming cytoskeletal protein [Pseudomonadota bacterium]
MSNPYDDPNVKHPSVLGPTLKFKGELVADENLLIHGEVEGSIKHSSLLTVAKNGTLKANVTAEYVSIDGNVVGDIGGSKSVIVSEGADVTGNIFSPVVTLREGAKFNGKIDMSGKSTAENSKKRTASADTKVTATPSEPADDKKSASAA